MEEYVRLLGFAALGAAAGALSGVTGIGGGVIIVPALIYIFGFSAHMAQGTTLALLVPPIGILAAWNYYQKGFVDIRAALAIAAAFVIGAMFGSKVAIALPAAMLRKIFAAVLVAIAVEMFFQK